VIFVRLFGRRGFLRDRHVLVRMSLVLAHGPEGLEFLRWKPWRMELDDENLDLPIQTIFFIAISNYQKVLWNMANSSFFFDFLRMKRDYKSSYCDLYIPYLHSSFHENIRFYLHDIPQLNMLRVFITFPS
jgi:hypothetical protein